MTAGHDVTEEGRGPVAEHDEDAQRERFWEQHYVQVVEGGQHWLDYSNARVQAQTFALCLEAAGPVQDRRCLDVGCGWGQFSRLLAGLGASEVVGADIVPELVAALGQRFPDQRWVRLSPSDEGALEPLGRFDVVFAVEVLQLVPFTRSLRALWAQVVPGGRLVAMVANGACPIVRRTRSRFDDRYLAPTAASLADDLAQLPDVAHAAVRGCHFRDDQALVPYEAGPWQAPGPATWTEEPNRIQFALVRRA